MIKGDMTRGTLCDYIHMSHLVLCFHIAASMTNHITWYTIDSESFLDVDVQLNLTLEVFFLNSLRLESRVRTSQIKVPFLKPRFSFSH